MTRELTGRHVLAIVVAAFAVIIAANLTMLFAATGSFPGLVVKNSYVAGQGWDARTNAQRDLAWSAEVQHRNGELRIALTDDAGQPVTSSAPVIRIGRPTTAAVDYSANAVWKSGTYRVPAHLAPGRWRVDLAFTEPKPFSTTVEIWVEEAD